MSKKPDKSSLHPHGFPSFSETLTGLQEGLTKLGINLVGAGAGIVGNLIGSLANLRKSAQQGDEDAENAYLEAIAMLRNSGSSTAETILRDLGEELGKDEGIEGSQDMQESDTAGTELESTQAPAEQSDEAILEMPTPRTPENSARSGKIICQECGAQFKSLTNTHLLRHGLSPVEYRKKYGLETIPPGRTGSLTRDAGGTTKRKRVAQGN